MPGKFPRATILTAALLALVNAPARGAAPVPPEKLLSLFPPAGATNACTDTPLHLEFSAAPSLAKTGTIELLDDAGTVLDSIDASAPTRTKTIGGLPNFTYYPILITANSATIAFQNNLLSYGKTYHVKISGNPFTDPQGRPIDLSTTDNWHFTTKPAAPALPAQGPRRLTIAADNSGDFATLQGALDFLPNNNSAPTTLFLRKGTYHEIVYFAKKDNLTLLGEDRTQTILAYPDNQNLNNTDRSAMPGGYRRGMLRAVNTTNLVIANLTLHNTTPKGCGQAESLILSGGPNARTILANLDLASFQDTLQINGQAYVSNCTIEGDVDFMWGTGPAFFENCDCKALTKNAYYTQIRNTPANHGYIYDHCLFEGAPNVTGAVLSRIDATRFPASEVALLNCTLTDAVSPAAWRFDRGGGENTSVHFWESNSHTPAGSPVDDSHRLEGSRQLTPEKDADTLAHYANPTWVLGGTWTPTLPPIITTQPFLNPEGTLSAEAIAIPAPKYQWQKNATDIPGATQGTLHPQALGTYTLTISNPAGKATTDPIAIPAR